MQLNYSDKPAPALEGMLYDSATIGMEGIVTRIAEADLEPGLAVVAGAEDDTVVQPAGDLDGFQGFVVRTMSKEPHPNTDFLYAEKDVLPVLRRGRIWVRPETAVTPTSPVHVRVDGSGRMGAVRGSSVTDETIDISARAAFLRSADADELVPLDINLP